MYIERLTVTHADDYPYSLVPRLRQRLSLGTNLRHVHLRFLCVANGYKTILDFLVRTSTSFQTMIFEIQDGTCEGRLLEQLVFMPRWL